MFFSELEIVIRHLIELKQSVKTILALLSNENKLHPGAKENLPVTLPLLSIADTHTLEEYLQIDTNSKSFVSG